MSGTTTVKKVVLKYGQENKGKSKHEILGHWDEGNIQQVLGKLCNTQSYPGDLRMDLLYTVLDAMKIEKSKHFSVELLEFVFNLICKGDLLTAALLETLAVEYLRYVDVAFYSFKCLKRMCSHFKAGEIDGLDSENCLCNVYDILRVLTRTAQAASECAEESELIDLCLSFQGGGGEGKDLGSKESYKAAKFMNARLFKHAFTECWISFLRLELPSQILKKALIFMPEGVIEHMTTPLLLSDILTGSVDQGGLIGILALNGLFVLVLHYGLEYPNFYKKLYNMITPSTFLTKYRVKFYRLVDKFLSSPLVPAYLMAAFIKKFARLALQTPPHGSLISMTFIFNLIRRHPSCAILLESRNGGKDGDPFDEASEDPARARALDSSLWELESLKHHYYHEVARFVTIFKRDMTQRHKYTEIDVEKFLTRSYDETFKRENCKRLKMCSIKFMDKEEEELFIQ